MASCVMVSMFCNVRTMSRDGCRWYRAISLPLEWTVILIPHGVCVLRRAMI
jgi:hypothetical protein